MSLDERCLAEQIKKKRRTELHLQQQKTIRDRFLTAPIIRVNASKLDKEQQQQLNKAFLHETYLVALKSGTLFGNLNPDLQQLQEHYEKLAELIARGANLNAPNITQDYGFAPIHIAAAFLAPDLLGFLLVNGACPFQVIKVPFKSRLFFKIDRLFPDHQAPWYYQSESETELHHVLPTSFKCQATPSQLYSNIKPNFKNCIIASYEEIVERAKKTKKHHQNKLETLAIIMAANYQFNEHHPLTESIHHLLPNIFNFIATEISKEEVTKVSKFSFVENHRQQFFKKSVTKEVAVETTPEPGVINII